MDFSVIFQLRTKKFWWMDVIFYFTISLFIATILCYVIFLVKNDSQRKDIEKEDVALQTFGTGAQRDQEQAVLTYQKKINDYTNIFKNHGFASQVFWYMQQETRPNIWFDRFGMAGKDGVISLSGESDDNEAFSRQVAVFEKSEYVKNINVVNSSSGESSKLKFNLTLSLDPKIFTYIADFNPVVTATPILETTTPNNQQVVETGGQTTENTTTLSNEKLIIIFKILGNNGKVDLQNNKVSVDVPFGTDIKNVNPTITLSPKAKVFPTADTKQDFSNPVVYSVAAEDGSTQEYTVSVNVLPKPVQESNANFIMIAGMLSVLVIVIITILVLVFYRKRLQKNGQI